MEEMVLQLGMVKSGNKKPQEYHCNSFMVDYKENKDYDLHYRNLTQCCEISKSVREDKQTKETRIIYQSMDTKEDAVAAFEYSRKKTIGKPREGEPHARFDVAGDGDETLIGGRNLMVM